MDDNFMEQLTRFITVFSPIITFVGAFVTVFVTLRNSTATRRAALINNFVSNRLTHISDLRTLVFDFCSEYMKGEDKDKNIMFLTKSKVELSIFGNKDIYMPLIKHMQECIDSEFDIKKYNQLIHDVQNLSNKIWEITKYETSSKMKSDSLIHKTTKTVTNTITETGDFVVRNTYGRVVGTNYDKDDNNDSEEKI